MRSFQKTLAAVAASAALVAAYAQTTTDNGSGVPSADVQSPIGAPTSSHATNPEKDRLSTTGVLRTPRSTQQATTTAAPMNNDTSSTAATPTDNSAAASPSTTDNSAAASSSDNSTAVATSPRADRN